MKTPAADGLSLSYGLARHFLVHLTLYKKENPDFLFPLVCSVFFCGMLHGCCGDAFFESARTKTSLVYIYIFTPTRLAPIMKMHLAGRDTIVLAAAFYRSAFGAHSENTTHTHSRGHIEWRRALRGQCPRAAPPSALFRSRSVLPQYGAAAEMQPTCKANTPVHLHSLPK